MPATDDLPGFAGTERVTPPGRRLPDALDEHLATRAAVRPAGSTVQDDDSPWPHPCHCEHVAGWLAGISDKLTFLTDRDEREAGERRDKAEAARAGDKSSER